MERHLLADRLFLILMMFCFGQSKALQAADLDTQALVKSFAGSLGYHLAAGRSRCLQRSRTDPPFFPSTEGRPPTPFSWGGRESRGTGASRPRRNMPPCPAARGCRRLPLGQFFNDSGLWQEWWHVSGVRPRRARRGRRERLAASAHRP